MIEVGIIIVPSSQLARLDGLVHAKPSVSRIRYIVSNPSGSAIISINKY